MTYVTDLREALDFAESFHPRGCEAWVLQTALGELLAFLAGWPLAICRECKTEAYCPEEYSCCATCQEYAAADWDERQAEQEYRDGLEALADSLGDAVRCGDRSESSARASYAAAARRHR